MVHEPRRGYGSAYLAGFAAARGEYIVMADADLTYDFDDIPRFVEQLDEGAELVMGDRMDNIQPGAMPWLHRYVGNPILTGRPQPLLPHRRQRRPLRHARAAPRRAAAPRPAHHRDGVRLGDGHPGLEGEAARSAEFPIEYHPRGGESKLSSFRDGWRHLRFLLVHSPTYLFVIPGAVHGRARRADRRSSSSPGLDIFGRAVGPAHDDRRARC